MAAQNAARAAGHERSGSSRVEDRAGTGAEQPRPWLRRAAIGTGIALLIAAGITLYAAARVSGSTASAKRSLRDHALVNSAQSTIMQEHFALQRYQLEPTKAVRQQYVDAARAAGDTLRDLADRGGRFGRDARRLTAEQTAYQTQADHLVEMATSADPDQLAFAGSAVLPAYETLIRDVGAVSTASAVTAERDVASLRTAQLILIAGSVAGLGLGVVLFLLVMATLRAWRRAVTAVHEAADKQSKLLDPLTGLPNQTLFTETLRGAIQDLGASGGRGVAVLVISLNGFETVRDSHGPGSADQLLVAAGRRLRRVVRDIDVVARLGGNDFGALLQDVSDVQSVRIVTDRVEKVLVRNFRLQTGTASVSPSVGVAIGGVGADAEELVRRADVAMCRARSAGGGVAISDTAGASDAPRRSELPGDLRALLHANDPDGQLAIDYQPVVRFADAAVTTVEAVVRWRHPRYGVLSCEEFRPVAEAHGLETPLMGHLLSLVAAQAADWQAAGNPLAVSINVAPRCLLDPWFVPAVQAATERVRLAPEWLRLEVSESGLTAQPDIAVATLRELRERGVPVSVDECGDGFSALAQLKQLPVDEVKIDRGLVGELTGPGGREPRVRGIIEMAHILRLNVVADGVADVAALAMLLRLGCDYAQGSVLSEPVPAPGVPAACERAHRQAWGALMREEIRPASGLDEVCAS